MTLFDIGSNFARAGLSPNFQEPVAEALQAKRRAALAQLNTLTQAIFVDFFESAKRATWEAVLLRDVADMVTGYSFRSEEYTDKSDAINLCRGANVLL